MKKLILKTLVTALAAIFLLAAAVSGANLSGRASVGFVLVDEVGSLGVNQSTYNLYEGVNFSMDNLRFDLGNRTWLYGRLRNVTLDNRNLSVGLTRAGSYGVFVRNNSYRRNYDFDGDISTRRQMVNGSFWVQPSPIVRLFGGYGEASKSGSSSEIYGLRSSEYVDTVDYNETNFHYGMQLRYQGYHLRTEVRESTFKDKTSRTDDRASSRIRIDGVAPIPGLNGLTASGGFQHFESRFESRIDTLSANTVWGAIKGSRRGYSLKYSLIWDRARRTGDLVATDNISHAVYATRTWLNSGGLTLGYTYRTADAIPDELVTKGYFVSAWARPFANLTLRGNYGDENRRIEQGATLTGKRAISRIKFSARYRLPEKYGYVRGVVENRQIENSDIGSKAEFLRGRLDLQLIRDRIGDLFMEYSYSNGEYSNLGGESKFSDHVISGDFMSTTLRIFQLGFGGTYVRSRQDVDIESSMLRFKALGKVSEAYWLEIDYNVHNFDNLGQAGPVYTEYYTANVLELKLTHQF